MRQTTVAFKDGNDMGLRSEGVRCYRLRPRHAFVWAHLYGDETARTYELEEQIAAPFSGYVSSAQRVGDSNSMLVASGQAKTFTEYERYGLPIATYEMEAEKYIYRVYKYEL